MDKTSGGTVTQTRTYYPAAGAMRIGGTLYYMLKDHLGSASVITNASGLTVSGGEQRYYPYGESRLTATMLTDKLFTGQREMAGLGIYHYQTRFYSPKLGRFLSPDTIIPDVSNPQAWNRYSYVVNNPLKYTDPTGHMYACDGCGMVGTIDDVFKTFKDSPFVYYYTQLAATERSIHEYHSNPTNGNKIIMEANIAQARTEKQSAVYRVPSDKFTEAMLRYPSILGGGLIGGEEVDLGSEFGGFGGNVIDGAATPILPYMTPTPTPTQTSTSTPTQTPTSTPTPPMLTPAPSHPGGPAIPI